MTRRLPLAVLVGLVFLALGACGHRGDPLPPLKKTPPQPTRFRLAQRGNRIELSALAPAVSVDGVPYRTLALEFLHGDGVADLEKTGTRLVVQTQAAGHVVQLLPLPSPGTLLRASARAMAGGDRSPRTLIQALEVQPPLEPPRELVAALGHGVIALSWTGSLPKAVPPPALPGQTNAAVGGASAARSGEGDRAGAAASRAASPSGPAAPTTTLTQTPADPRGNEAQPATNGGGETAAPLAKEASAGAAKTARRNGFFVYRRIGGGRYETPLGEEPLENAALEDKTAPLGQTACYVVRAVASTGPLIESEPSNEACVAVRDVAPPAAPTGLTALPRGAALELLWIPSGEEDLAGYRLYRGLPDAATEKIAEVGASQTSFVDEAARRGVRYRYTLTAVDRSGNESPASEPVELLLP